MGPLPAVSKPIIHLTLILLLALAAPCQGVEDADQPISIEANRMVSQENQNTVVFLGKVDARQGNLIIRSEEMTVFYSEKPANKDGQPSTPGPGNQNTSQLEKLICKQNVKISEGDWLGTGDRMDYFAKERKVVLTGNAKAWQGPNMVAGKTITYYLNEQRSAVEQDEKSKGRVKAVIHPESKNKP